MKKYLKYLLLIFLVICLYDNLIFVLRPFLFRKVNEHFYVSVGTSDSLVKTLEKTIDNSYRRNEVLFYNIENNIDVYFLNSSFLINLFSKVGIAANYNTFFYSYITINAEAYTLDVIAHEVCHSLFYKQLGYFKWFKQRFLVPTWFEEGLAGQMDFRKDTDILYYKINKDKISKSYLDEYNSKFYQKEIYWDNYAISKKVVSDWLIHNDINKLLQQLQRFSSFEEAYANSKKTTKKK